jgi:hypothetical protein
MFRDESQGLSDKHRRSNEAQAQVKAQRSRVTDLPSTSSATDSQLALIASPQPAQFQPLPPLSISLMTSPEDQATCFFFQNYVLGGQDLSKGNLDYLSDIYSSEDGGPCQLLESSEHHGQCRRQIQFCHANDQLTTEGR